MRNFIFFLVTVVLVGCDNFETVINQQLDITPPFLNNVDTVTVNKLEIISNEDITFISESYISREGLLIKSINSQGSKISIEFSSDLIPGKEYLSEFRIEDKNRNTLSFISKFYGFNPRLPNLIINEFITKGSKTNPNKVELYIKEGGNLSGVTLFNGTSSSYDSIFIFPDIEVTAGEYIVIRTVSDNYPTPCIEIDNINIEHDKKFIQGVRDIRIDNFKLSSTNGVISIYDSPFGKPLDVVIYSKNRNDDTKNNRNFGLKKTLDRIDEVSDIDMWIGESEYLFPDDVIYIGDSTTTRSLNRVGFNDQNSREDWITVESRQSSFGFVNSLLEY
ncbi:hypothetical protein EW093_12220 [Thiospirochaeta perfilievii]|uniref:TP-1001-like C-terminal domain-containing protein n=1 Tax=Thiospirochaeta perfilievii TaxID=252967 RepID=A0A5C1QFY5_9SPIO|nr:hypothetical protein [Thiospirochaeta perfilievii]QEN05446.1 hypothetical protein EW093_12220 [Thiospirochaeta perfilievii]